MANVYMTRKPACYGVRLGRECAIRACVLDTRELRHEFDAIYVIYDSNTQDDIWADLVKEFATRKGLRIIRENPIMTIKGDRYDVDIEYTIVW